MNQIDILKWAAGARIDLPDWRQFRGDCLLDLLGIDQEELLLRLRQHRLENRFLVRYTTERPNWCSQFLLERLHRSRVEAQRLWSSQLREIHKISSRFSTAHEPIIILKGMSSFGLTGEPRCIRHSGDLDVCCADPEQLWAGLLDSGYRGKRHFTHEFGKLTRDTIILDLHNYYPVLAYPPDMAWIDFRELGSEKYSQTLRGPLHFKEFEIGYDDLRRESVLSVVPETKGLVFPNPAMAILVMCAHGFRNYTTGLHYLRENQATKLAELADICELTRLREFNPIHFMGLVERYGARDSINFVHYLLDSYSLPHSLPSTAKPNAKTLQRRSWRSDTLEDRGEQLGAAVFPENLACGGWVVLDDADNWLIPRDAATAFSRMGGMPTYAPVERRSVSVVCFSVQDYPAADSDVEIEISQRSDGILVNIQIPIATQDADYVFLIHFGGDRYLKLDFDKAQLANLHHKKEFSAEWENLILVETKGAIWRTQISFPGELLPARDASHRVCPLLLSIGKSSGKDASVGRSGTSVEYLMALIKR